MEQYEDMLKGAHYVTNRFNDSSKPWLIGDADDVGIDHIRYVLDYTEDKVWYKRIAQFFRMITVDYLKPGHLWLQINDGKRGNWFVHVGSMWEVYVMHDSHLPEATVDDGHILTLWAENASYVTLFGPNVGKEILDFIKEDPYNMYAQRIVKAMYASYKANNMDREDEED